MLCSVIMSIKTSPNRVEVDGTMIPGIAGEKEGEWIIPNLFRYKRKWWIYYGYDRLTGSFKTKQKALDCYAKGGR